MRKCYDSRGKSHGDIANNSHIQLLVVSHGLPWDSTQAHYVISPLLENGYLTSSHLPIKSIFHTRCFTSNPTLRHLITKYDPHDLLMVVSRVK